jgi:hypothetical protein
MPSEVDALVLAQLEEIERAIAAHDGRSARPSGHASALPPGYETDAVPAAFASEVIGSSGAGQEADALLQAHLDFAAERLAASKQQYAARQLPSAREAHQAELMLQQRLDAVSRRNAELRHECGVAATAAVAPRAGGGRPSGGGGLSDWRAGRAPIYRSGTADRAAEVARRALPPSAAPVSSEVA